jgi:hypothetical protein
LAVPKLLADSGMIEALLIALLVLWLVRPRRRAQPQAQPTIVIYAQHLELIAPPSQQGGNVITFPRRR